MSFTEDTHDRVFNQGQGRDTHQPVKLPRLLNDIKQELFTSCNRLFEHMFSASDDLLYDLSKRASSNNEENLLFDSMREIRVKRKGLVNQFFFELTNTFNQLLIAGQPANSDQNPNQGSNQSSNLSSNLSSAFTAADFKTSSLSLVESDQLETQIATGTMVTNSRLHFKESLYTLVSRLDYMLLTHVLKSNVNEDNNPLDPKQIAHCFSEASKILKLDIKAKLILFKLFEKHLLKQLGSTYSDCNQILIDNNVLPDVPLRARNLQPNGSPLEDPQQSASAENAPPEEKTAKQRQFADTSSNTTQANARLNQALDSTINRLEATTASLKFHLDVNTLSNLMAAVKPTAIHSNGAFFPNGSQYFNFTQNPGPALSPPDLSKQLTRFQLIAERMLTTHTQTLIPDIITQILHKNAPEPKSLKQDQENIINLVSLFFDNILADETLPSPIQALVCRMQIPVLKIALQDASFLENSEHVARQFINTITDIGVGFDDEQALEQDPFYRRVLDGVTDINRDQSDIIAAIETVYKDLSLLRFKDKNKAQLVEERTNQKEIGISKKRQAEKFAKDALYTKMKNALLPDTISDFLTDTWMQVLIMTYVKFGKSNAIWVDQEQMISDIIWLSNSQGDSRSLQRRVRLKSRVLEIAFQGLTSIYHDAQKCQSVVDTINATLADIENIESVKVAYRELSNTQTQTLANNEDQSWKEETAVDRQRNKFKTLSNEFFEMARDIDTGCWFEYFDALKCKNIRCKLSAKVDSETYIFVNRLGRKLFIKTRRQFACDLQFNKAKAIDTNPTFDRVMNKVVNSLLAAA